LPAFPASIFVLRRNVRKIRFDIEGTKRKLNGTFILKKISSPVETGELFNVLLDMRLLN
jgi:hypothetical protein